MSFTHAAPIPVRRKDRHMVFMLEYAQNYNRRFSGWVIADTFATEALARDAAQHIRGVEGDDWQITPISEDEL